jgi:hypothetical protein
VRTFEYRLFVNKGQHAGLIECLIQSRGIYNAMLEMVKAQYEQDGTFPSKYDLEAAFKGQGEHVPATTVQMLADRLSKALKRFLAAKKHEIPGIGFPRFKKLGHFLKIKLHRPIEGTPKSEGHTVENPRFYRTSQKTLRRKQRLIHDARRAVTAVEKPRKVQHRRISRSSGNAVIFTIKPPNDMPTSIR